MKNESIVFKGINRHSSDIATENGYCEELINVRSENGEMRIVPARTSLRSVSYDDIFEHVTSSCINYIGHYKSGSYHAFEKFPLSSSGTAVVITDNLIPGSDEIYYTCVNNFLVISDKTAVNTYIFIFKENSYSLFSSDTNISISSTFEHTYMPYDTDDRYYESEVALSEIYEGESTSTEVLDSKMKKQNIKELMTAQRKRCIDDNDGLYADGTVIIAITATLWDGSEIQIGNFRTFELDRINTDSVLYFGTPDNIIRLSQGYGEAKDEWTLVADKYSYGGIRCTISSSNASSYKDIIQKINIYGSIPYSKIDFDKSIYLSQAIEASSVYVRMAKCSFYLSNISDDKVNGMLLYLQESYTLNELISGSKVLDIKFSEDIATNTALTVSSNTNRAGKIFNYNKRLHFFDSKAKIKSNAEYITSQFDGGTQTTADVYVFVRINGDIKVFKHSAVTIQTSTYGLVETIERLSVANFFIFPDSRAYRIVFKNSSNKVADFPLVSSRLYNYSFACYGASGSKFDFITDSAVITELASYSTCGTTIEYDEDTAINVTAQGNPIYFPVQNSYSVDHRIVDLAVAFEEISAVQTGQYPVYIFTKNGIFALEQGSGDVLYGSIVPVNSDEVTGNVKQTRYGIVYVSNGKVMLLNGRQSKELSEFINGEPDMDIRGESGSSYRLCCCNSNLYNVLLNISSYISATATSGYLKEFLETAVINWSSSEDELIISDNSHNYSYVFNFKYNAWHKTTERYFKSRINDTFLRRTSGSTKNIIDYSSKESTATTFHIQTRPLMLSPNQYTVILRSILNIKSVVAATELVSVYIFGSDNCTDWHCIAGAQKKGCTLHNVRLNRCDKSYRYHVIIIGGLIKPSTEILNVVMTIEDKLNSKIR